MKVQAWLSDQSTSHHQSAVLVFCDPYRPGSTFTQAQSAYLEQVGTIEERLLHRAEVQERLYEVRVGVWSVVRFVSTLLMLDKDDLLEPSRC